MKRSTLRSVGQVGVLIGLCVACSGKVHELGNPGGVGGGTHDSNTGVGASGGQTSTINTDLQGGVTSTVTMPGPTGGNYPDPIQSTGGTYPGPNSDAGGTYPGPNSDAGGTRPNTWSAGGTYPGPNTWSAGGTYPGPNTWSAGGTHPGPNTWSAGGTYTDSSLYQGGSTQYPRDDLPKGAIDATCQCSTATEVCNAAKECVPRCIADGSCAEWLTNRAVKSMYHDGTALYYATARSTDVLGNPGQIDGSLYSVAEGASTPIVVNAAMLDPEEILGRYKGATYLSVFNGTTTYSLVEVTDAGVVTKLADSDTSDMDLLGRWLIYVDAGGRRLVGYDLEQGKTPIPMLDATSAAASISDVIVVGDNAVCRMANADACSVSLTNPGAGPTCGIKVFADTTRKLLAADGTRIFFGGDRHGEVRSYDHLGTPLLTVFNNSGYPKMDTTVLVGGWLYSSAALNEYDQCVVLRYPTTVGRLPQTVLPLGQGSPIFAVGKAEIYWSNRVKEANSRQYVFRTPLPGQPCDAELPCVNPTPQCIEGTCRGL